MTPSEPAASEVFAHVRHTDGGTSLVGRYRLVAPQAGRAFGEFGYVGSWLRNDHGRAFALDPEHLPLARGAVTIERRGRLPGALADSTPDAWGVPGETIRSLGRAFSRELG